ncbi:MAG: lipopolysaccharide assembly protein LapA domain-containing protein [Xenococcaceae cyanobacterium]
MNSIGNLITSFLVAVWIAAIAIFSIQNIQAVSLKFLNFTSLDLPIGVLLAFSAGVGMMLGAIMPLFWQKSKNPDRRRV